MGGVVSARHAEDVQPGPGAQSALQGIRRQGGAEDLRRRHAGQRRRDDPEDVDRAAARRVDHRHRAARDHARAAGGGRAVHDRLLRGVRLCP